MAGVAIDIDATIDRIASGESQASIARSYNVSASTLHNYLSATPDLIARSARARLISAEAWLDRGLAVIESSLSKSGDVDAGAARAYAQECARRAAIRNPAYRDKLSVDADIRVRSAAEMPDAELARIAAGGAT